MPRILTENECDLLEKNIVPSGRRCKSASREWSDDVVLDMLNTISFLRSNIIELETHVGELGGSVEEANILERQRDEMEEKLLELGYTCLYCKGQVEFKNLNEA